MPALRLLLAAWCLLAATGCAGYRLGGSRPAHLAAVSGIHVSMVDNKTQMPRAGAHATNSIIDALTRDGTYRLTGISNSDARLNTSLHSITYRQGRSSRRDTLRSEELLMTVTLHWTLIDSSNPTRILEQGRSTGTTIFFVAPNLQTARQNALPDALKRAAEFLVARLADGF